MHEHNNIKELSLRNLRAKWEGVWNLTPHARIGRKMLERSLIFKRQAGRGKSLSNEEQKCLNKHIKAYKRNSKYFEQGHMILKPGMQIVKEWGGRKHRVTVLRDGFEYQDNVYKSLSKIAFVITGSKRNGWAFFNLKKERESS